MLNYGLKSSYISRLQPAYFNDTLPDSTAWQADVYRLAALLARRVGAKRLIDVGCGRGEKLIPYADEFEITGFDYGPNIEQCQRAYAAGEWLATDLNTVELQPEGFRDAVVICADVIEHLPDPSALIRSLRNASETARYVLVSTPDRERVYDAALNGEPKNPYHVREWTNLELVTWFKSEKLPVVWWGWTISNDAHPDQRWTSLVVLSKKDVVEKLPASYENNGGIARWNPPRPAGSDLKVWMTPTPSEAERDITNSINHIVVYLQQHLQDYGVELVEQPDNADLRVGHAGQGSIQPLDVAHYHGLYPTAQWENPGGYFTINANVIRNLKHAKAITAPSQWIADVIRRDMHVSPHIIGWGVDINEWTPVENPHVYALWNKARVDPVCDPAPMLQLAARAHDTLFLTTFGEGTPNVKTIGRQPYEVMKEHVRKAAVYLSTNVETFGIGVLEALASGVPVLGFRQGAIQDYVQHGVHGYLVEPGDMDGLYEGLRYCLKHRKTLGTNARELAKQFSWDRVAREFAALYRHVLEPRGSGVKVSVVIPCHNYAQYVMEAVESVRAQTTTFDFEIIVVNDSSTDQSANVLNRELTRQNEYYHEVDFGNLSATRNYGIEKARGEFICCLDADDRLGSPMFLEALADALSSDPLMGIAFTSIQFMDSEGKLGHKSTWPNGYDFEKQLHRHNQVPSCCLFRKEAWRRAGGFKPYFVYAQDAEFWTQLGLLGYSAKHVIEEGWFHYRLHSKSQSQVHRTGEVPEPDWTEYYPSARDNERPFASDGKAPFGSWPVRFYHEPDVSVIIPVGTGHEKAVKDALHSVEGQTHRYWECIVVNDTGKPLCLEGFPWAKVIETSGSVGAGAARNTGAKIARAPFVIFLDADDMLKPHFIEKTLKAYRQFGRYAYTDWLTHDKQTNWQVHETPDYSFSAIWERPSIHPVTALMPRSWFQKAGGFDETLPSMEDVDLFMKFLTHGYCGVRVKEPLLIYNMGSGQRRGAGETRKEEFKALMVERYGAYMRGETMCNCVEPPKGRSPLPPSPEIAADYQAQYGDMVKVQYTWEFAPEGPAPLRGAATRVQYGRRARGEIFYVWQKDFENNPEMFTRLENYSVEAVPTVAPPEPTPVAPMTVMPGPDSVIVMGDTSTDATPVEGLAPIPEAFQLAEVSEAPKVAEITKVEKPKSKPRKSRAS